MGKLLSSTSLENEYITMAMNGDYSFVKEIDEYDISVIFNDVKRMNYREDVVDALFQAFQEENPFFAFQLVYKNEKYKEFTIFYLTSLDHTTWAVEKCVETLFSPSYPWFYSYLRTHPEQIVSFGDRIISLFFRYAFDTGDMDTVHALVNSNNIEVRSTCLSFVFESSLRSYIDKIYPGSLVDYFVIKDNDGKVIEKIPEEVLSECATNLFDYVFREDLYQQIMNFILENYPDNHLLSYLLREYREDNFDHRKEFLEKNVFTLYDSSCDAQLDMYYSFPHLLDQKRILEVEQFLKMVEPGQEEFIYQAFQRGLGKKILTYFHKYFALSDSKETKLVESGSCCIAYKVGNYVLKISNHKYSYEDPVCPNCYLIVKNYDEYFTRGYLGVITGAVEVEKFNSKRVEPGNEEIEARFRSALKELGYVLEDYLVGEKLSNLHYLDDYHDADCDDPEALPLWFKENPVVLIDRDLVFKADVPKHLKKCLPMIKSEISED